MSDLEIKWFDEEPEKIAVYDGKYGEYSGEPIAEMPGEDPLDSEELQDYLDTPENYTESLTTKVSQRVMAERLKQQAQEFRSVAIQLDGLLSNLHVYEAVFSTRNDDSNLKLSSADIQPFHTAVLQLKNVVQKVTTVGETLSSVGDLWLDSMKKVPELGIDVVEELDYGL